MGRGLGLWSGGLGCCYVCVSCESGFYVWMTGPGICILWLADTAHLKCTQCSILLHLIDICFLYRVFVNGRYRRLVCVLLTDLDLSRHHPP